MKLTQKLISGALTLSMALGAVSFQLPKAPVEAATDAVSMVEEMGAGWNLGNTFDSDTSSWNSSPTVTELETAWGNPVTTQSMIDAIAFYGFKTVRVPVTWKQMSDESGNINTEFLARLKEVVDYCYANDLYVILNVHHDGTSGNWLYNGTSAMSRFSALWTNIANYFKDYDSHLVFEGWNEIDWNYSTITTMGQAFVDAVRATGGNNANRLLVIPGKNTNYANTTSSSFVMPTDPANMLAVDIHYYDPTVWTVYSDDDDSWGWGVTPQNTWGSDSEVAQVKNDISALKSRFTDQGIGVLIGEYGVENYNKDEDDRLLYTKTVASAAYEMEGVCACLWDSSNGGDMKYFDRQTQSWLNSAFGDFYKELTGGNYQNPDGLILTHRVTITQTEDGVWDLKQFEGKAVLKEAIWSVDVTGLTDDGYYGLAAVQANVLSDTITEPTTEDYLWAFSKVSISSDDNVYTTSLSDWYHTVNDEDVLYDDSYSLAYDYLKIEIWYFGSDGTAPTAVTVNPTLTLVFEEPIWVTKDYEIPDTPVTTTTTTTTITTTTTTTEISTVVKGDADCNGVISIADSVLISRYIAEDSAVELTEEGRLNADCNGDGNITAADTSVLNRYLANLGDL